MLDISNSSVEVGNVWQRTSERERPSCVGEFVPINSIHVPQQQSRRYFDESKMASLVQSIQEQGILEPLLVRPIGDQEYELVAGERRYRAATEAQLTEVPVIVKELNEAEAVQVALIENLQREDLNPIEETEGILQLLSLQNDLTVDKMISFLYRRYNEMKGRTSSINSDDKVNAINESIDAVFSSLGKMRWDSFVKNRLPLLNLPAEILDALRTGSIEYTKAKAISQVKDPELRKILISRAVEEQLSLNVLKQIINSNKPDSETEFESRIKKAVKFLQKAKSCEDPVKQEKLKSLMLEIESLLS